MLFDYILLLVLFILPAFYKYSFWLYVIQLKEYRFDRFKEYISTPQGKNALYNFWIFIEIPLFIISFVIFFNSPFAIIIYNVLFYFLVIQNLFVIGKLLRGKILKPKITFRLLLTYSLILFGLGVDVFYILYNELFSYIYVYLLSFLLFSPLVIFISIIITLPLVNFLKNKKINKASDKSIKLKEIIKIGITGSYGKTSVKEYLNYVLKNHDKTLSTPENINTELGVSDIVINKLKNTYKYFVAEMGAYKIGEIKTLGEIINHKYGFITAIGNQHLALFGGLQNTIKAKSEIAEKVLENNGTLYINWDNENIKKAIFDKKLNIIKYGTKKTSDCIANILEIKDGITKFEVIYKGGKTLFTTKLIGKHNVVNLSGVIAFAFDMGIKKTELKRSILNLNPPKNTLEIKETKNYIKINDTYNLSEDGLLAGIDVLNSFDKNKSKVLILDDILELGEEARSVHYILAEKIAKKKLVDKIMFVGVNYKSIFLKGLKSGGFDSENILTTTKDIETNSVILFEGKKSAKYLNNI